MEAYRFEPVDRETLVSIMTGIQGYCESQFGSCDIIVHRDLGLYTSTRLSISFPFGGRTYRFEINLGEHEYTRSHPHTEVKNAPELFDDPELFKME